MGPIARITVSAAVCATLIAPPATAQGVRIDLLPPLGTEVRATLSADGDEVRAEGILTEASIEGLVLEADRGRHIYRIPAEILLGLDVSRGRNCSGAPWRSPVTMEDRGAGFARWALASSSAASSAACWEVVSGSSSAL